MQEILRSEHFVQADSVGQSVHVMRAQAESADRGDVLILHGLGDHMGRFDWAVDLLIGAGFSVVGFDWPGNGKSDGVRGDSPQIAEAGRLVEEVIGKMDCQPVGVLAHSTGGFYAARFLAGDAAWVRELQWAWLNSPLISPSHGQPPLKIAAASALARFLPTVTLSTGVMPEDCHDGEDDFPEGVHNRISLRFGAELMQEDQETLRVAASVRSDLRLLLVQGSRDEVCPPRYAFDFFNRLKSTEKTLIYAKAAKHEPMQDTQQIALANSLRTWLAI